MASKFTTFVLFLCFVIANVSAYGVNVTCNFLTSNGVYTCAIQRALVLFDDEPINILGNPGSNTVHQVRITESRTLFIIRELFDTFPSLRELNIQDSGLRHIKPNVFRNATKLQTLFIHTSELDTLEANSFAGLGGLQSLRISDSKLSYLHEDVLAGLNSLVRLNFDENRISYLPTKLFYPVRSLRVIEFDGNQIKRLDNDMFLQNGANIESLYFNSNNISSVGPRFFDNLVNLNNIFFSGNNCTSTSLSRTNSSFFQNIRAAFSTCFNNFIEEPAVTTSTTAQATTLTTEMTTSTEIHPEVVRTYILKVSGKITLLDENGNEIFVTKQN